MSKNYQKNFRHHSKTFSFAARFFGKRRAEDIAKLYYFFRHVDDIADGNTGSSSEKESAIKNALKLTELKDIQAQFNIPNDVIDHFIKFSIEDISFETMENKKALFSYCYGVASTVGLSMCHLLGIRDKRAFYHAIDLGIAMQLTNICRDICEDYENNRIYLPELSKKILEDNDQKKIHSIQLEYLNIADSYYASGFRGLRYLPLRARFVIFVAAKLYQKIGLVIKKTNNYKIRSFLSGLNKFKTVVMCIPEFILANTSRSPLTHQRILHSEITNLPYAHV
tara:strand:- start:2812 stop:3654 length:843 start_codon:yes stop_codon:yes gene_type:complete